LYDILCLLLLYSPFFESIKMLKKLPLGIQTFSEIREDNYVYIDKTEHIYRLIQQKHNFFARPRRFGKSVLCSTLKALFQGRKELFEDLWITKNTDYAFPVHPVIHIDFGKITVESPKQFQIELMEIIDSIAHAEGVSLNTKISPGIMLQKLFEKLIEKYNTEKIILIIDEYDRPILHHLTEPESLKEIISIVQNFYTCIKALDGQLRFLFVTGITRFSKTNLFSGFNQISDLSMLPEYGHLVGYTDEELNTTLKEHVEHAAQESGLSIEDFKAKTKKYYNGYRFWENFPAGKPQIDLPRVYNPYSMLHNLENPTFKFYWFDSGTPTFLINLLRKNQYPIESFDGIEIFPHQLGGFEPDRIPLKSLLYQTGYLTVKSQERESALLTLTYPNFEVKEALLQQILVWITELDDVEVFSHARKISIALRTHDLDLLIDTLTSFYAAIPYTIHLAHEKYYQTIFYLILTLLGIKIDVEVVTNIGRIDAVIKTEKFIYLLEFKLNSDASKAIEQIKTKKYFEQYQLDSRSLTLLGISFNTQEKNIGDVKVEEVKK
jgi:hypothetical protein